tara:strand:+ start:59 stop:766 length:708 start_codon:yes stop_codon:yes gene_type:complete
MTDISKLYLKIHNTTGLKYLGVTHNDPNTYLGSGVEWKIHIKKHGRHDVTTHILFEDEMIGKETSDLFQEVSVWTSKFLNVVDDDNFANLMHESGVLGAKDNVYHRHLSLYDKWEHKLQKSFPNKNLFDIFDNYEKDKYNDKIVGSEQYEAFKFLTKENLKEIITKVFSFCLTPREERVIRMRFGIGLNTDHTLEEVGQQLNVSRTQIRHIEAKAMRKMKHSSVSSKLTSFLDAA